MSEACTTPPADWRCTRSAGHPGPCAPVPADQTRISTEGWAKIADAVAAEKGAERDRLLAAGELDASIGFDMQARTAIEIAARIRTHATLGDAA